MLSSLQSIPEIGLEFKPSAIVDQTLAFVQEHCNAMTINHTVRSAYWAAIIAQKNPSFAKAGVDMEAVYVSCILHDMGWAETKALLSQDKRFEVDGANIAKDFLTNANAGWDPQRIQRCWDSIALHTTPSIGRHAAPEVSLTGLGILADFLGPSFPNGPGGDNLITMDEYRAVMTLFPRSGFTEEGVKQLLCGFCRDKPATTYDNIVGNFGLKFGLDAKGTGKADFARAWEENQTMNPMLMGLSFLEKLDIQFGV